MTLYMIVQTIIISFVPMVFISVRFLMTAFAHRFMIYVCIHYDQHPSMNANRRLSVLQSQSLWIVGNLIDCEIRCKFLESKSLYSHRFVFTNKRQLRSLLFWFRSPPEVEDIQAEQKLVRSRSESTWSSQQTPFVWMSTSRIFVCLFAWLFFFLRVSYFGSVSAANWRLRYFVSTENPGMGNGVKCLIFYSHWLALISHIICFP